MCEHANRDEEVQVAAPAALCVLIGNDVENMNRAGHAGAVEAMVAIIRSARIIVVQVITGAILYTLIADVAENVTWALNTRPSRLWWRRCMSLQKMMKYSNTHAFSLNFLTSNNAEIVARANSRAPEKPGCAGTGMPVTIQLNQRRGAKLDPDREC
jgi:hypothetical protein